MENDYNEIKEKEYIDDVLIKNNFIGIMWKVVAGDLALIIFLKFGKNLHRCSKYIIF